MVVDAAAAAAACVPPAPPPPAAPAAAAPPPLPLGERRVDLRGLELVLAVSGVAAPASASACATAAAAAAVCPEAGPMAFRSRRVVRLGSSSEEKVVALPVPPSLEDVGLSRLRLAEIGPDAAAGRAGSAGAGTAAPTAPAWPGAAAAGTGAAAGGMVAGVKACTAVSGPAPALAVGLDALVRARSCAGDRTFLGTAGGAAPVAGSVSAGSSFTRREAAAGSVGAGAGGGTATATAATAGGGGGGGTMATEWKGSGSGLGSVEGATAMCGVASSAAAWWGGAKGAATTVCADGCATLCRLRAGAPASAAAWPV